MFAIIINTTQAQVSIGLSINIAPPAMPTYVQPPCPVEGYLWTPGYWSYNVDGYYWVPGVWMAPPRIGYLWTPGYWAFTEGFYRWHLGYWGLHIGYYGGINYGFGYGGVGFVGGMWQGNVFRYNTAVVNVNTTVVHNTYINRSVINNTVVNNNHYSFNGQGGVMASPNKEEQVAMKEQHLPTTTTQYNHENEARNDKAQYFSANKGKPHSMAMERVGGGRFNERGENINPSPRKENIMQNTPHNEKQRMVPIPHTQPEQHKKEIRNYSKGYEIQKRREMR